jgi:hypothetical protein
MGNAAKRVALAKDVIAQLDAKKFVPAAGVYVLRNPNGSCELCAIGALVASCCGFPYTNERRVLLECLRPTFTGHQLDLIESAFEAANMSAVVNSAEDVSEAARAHWRRCEDVSTSDSVQFDVYAEDADYRDERVMRLIMSNIITNNGTFVPEQL